jgi:zinc protease
VASWLAIPSLSFALALLGCAAAKGRGSAGRTAGTATNSGPAGSADAAAASAPPPAGPVEVARAGLGNLTATKWRLANGLEVILLPDPMATSISYMTWFRVGSRNENDVAGETGLAHLFEHLMFTQTKTTADAEFDRAMEAAGGNANAMTYYDFTAYVDDLPPEELALAVRLEADRMVNLDLRKRQVETERDVVAEERLASVEDSVDGVLDEMMYKQAFKHHPYRWPVIGWMKDIKAFTQDKAVAFYRRFYAPNNAIVVLTGRFDPAAALDLVARGYGAIPPSTSLPADEAKPERAPAAPVTSVIERPVPADRLVVGFPAPGLGDPDRAAYEVLNELLAGGPSSRLTRALVVEKEWASSVHGDIAPTRDPGLYAIWVQMTKGHAAEQAERAIVDAVADVVAHAPAAADVRKAATRLETAFWQDLSSSHGRADALGEFEIAAGDFRRLFARGEEYGRVTPEDVRRVAASYLGTGARSVVVARPKRGGGSTAQGRS